MDGPGAAGHWDGAYSLGETSRSWFQREPTLSLRMLAEAGATPDQSLIDVGGGASLLAEALLDRGHTDLTVLDVSAAALRIARRRLGPRADRVHWVTADVLAWSPPRTWDLWHDRAVLHFFADDHQQQRYLHVLDAATAAGSVAVLATFALDGPGQCSGLPVRRYGPGDLVDLLGPRWSRLAEARELHTTPTGAIQPFTWAAFHRDS